VHLRIANIFSFGSYSYNLLLTVHSASYQKV